MSRHGITTATLASAILMLACASLLRASEDAVPPQPDKAASGESTAKQPTKPLPQLQTPVPPPLPDLRQQVPTNPTVQNPAPQQNTLPNLAANSNATVVPNFIGDLGAISQSYNLLTTPFVDPTSGGQAFAVQMQADSVLDPTHAYLRGVTPNGQFTTSTVYLPVGGSGSIIQAFDGTNVHGRLAELKGLVPQPTTHPLALVSYPVPLNPLFLNILLGPGDLARELQANDGPAVIATDAADKASVSAVFNSRVVPIGSPSAWRQKFAENSSPLPRDRVYVNYNYFDATPTTIGSKGVNRVTPGFEKTFFDQWASVEVRLPFTTQLSNSADLTGMTNTSGAQFGNVTGYFKGLLYADPSLTISSGLGVQLPTASDTDISANGGEIFKIANNSVHLLPFLAATYTPGSRYYAQGALQFDFDANGNTVYGAPYVWSGNGLGVVPGALQQLGVAQDQTFLYASLATGYWIYRVTNPYERGLTGIAPTAELHYNTSLQRSDTVADVYGNRLDPLGQIASLNGVVGVNAVFGNNKYFTVGYSAPLGRADAQFNGELRVMFNYYFGGSRVNPRFNLVPSR